MKTLSPTQARVNLTSWLKKAAAGEDIGILCGDKIIALRPMEVHSADYALREYELTPKEFDDWIKRMDGDIAEGRKAGAVKRYSGNLEADVRD